MIRYRSALNDAQRWLRQANGKEIKEMVTPWLAQSGIQFPIE